jgi:MFS family permease
LLFAVTAFDELASGVPSTSAPDIERDLATTHAGLAMVLLVVPGIVALIVEPIIFLLADRYPRRWFIRGGMAGMAVASAMAALAPNAIVLSIALSLFFFTTGTATSLAQATLVDRSSEPGRTMARWALVSTLGDLGAPALFALLALFDRGWRSAFAVVAVVLVAATIGLCSVDIPGDGSGDDESPLWNMLWSALRDRKLVAWLFGMALCDLLDEILIIFASLHVSNDLDGGPLMISAVVGALVAGSAIGLVMVDRLLKQRAELTVLAASAIACAASYALWMLAPTPWLAVVLMVPVGMTAAPLYPLSAAQAYAMRPEQSGAVLAAGHIFTPFGLALPWLLGLAADHWGTRTALGLLAIEPIGIAILAIASRSSRRAEQCTSR